jgi:hypothetical protein
MEPQDWERRGMFSPRRKSPLVRLLGPGLIAGASDDGRMAKILIRGFDPFD